MIAPRSYENWRGMEYVKFNTYDDPGLGPGDPFTLEDVRYRVSAIRWHVESMVHEVTLEPEDQFFECRIIWDHDPTCKGLPPGAALDWWDS